MNNHKFYITTPIYYMNSKPHLGTLYSTVLADVAARWKRLSGITTFFLTGADEYGQKIAQRAEQQGKSPQEFVDSMVPLFKEVWKTYEISYDTFIRTTDAKHKQGVLALLAKLQEQGDIYKASYKGWYCVPCETFVTEFAKGDKPYCSSCKRELVVVEEENYFFRLSAYQDRLLAFYESNPHFIVPKERLNEVISFVGGGLRDLCISRQRVEWGIPFPGDSDQTVYVWADALTNYLSAIGFGGTTQAEKESFEKWWPANAHVIGKDIVRFHAVYWPAFLMAAGLPLPKHLLVHGFILFEDEKMSKSLGNVVDPLQLAQWYGEEQIRYYLTRQMAVTHDGHFSLHDVENHITADLANNLGNLLNRTISLVLNNDCVKVEPPAAWEPKSIHLREQSEEAFRSFWDAMEHYQYHVALSCLFKFVKEVNAYVQVQKPWVAAKENKELFTEIISASCHSLYTIGILLWPVMPKKMEELLASLGVVFEPDRDYIQELRAGKWDKTFMLKKTKKPLFARAEQHSHNIDEHAQAKENKEKKQNAKHSNEPEMITIDDFTKVQLLVGQIVSCEALEGSDKLYKLGVDMGSHGKRTILAGVAKHLAPEHLIGKKGVYVANLKPRKMLDVESQGMMLFAKNGKGEMVMATVADEVENGTRLT